MEIGRKTTTKSTILYFNLIKKLKELVAVENKTFSKMAEKLLIVDSKTKASQKGCFNYL